MGTLSGHAVAGPAAELSAGADHGQRGEGRTPHPGLRPEREIHVPGRPGTPWDGGLRQALLDALSSVVETYDAELLPIGAGFADWWVSAM